MYKVQKQITKKRGQLDSLHENSRDAKRLRRAGAREEKLGRVAARTMKRRQYYGEWKPLFGEISSRKFIGANHLPSAERIGFFRDCSLEPLVLFSDGDMVRFVTRSG
jgi:translation machinery-associated protein 16